MRYVMTGHGYSITARLKYERLEKEAKSQPALVQVLVFQFRILATLIGKC
jgi:hypothetical protein